MLISPLHLIDNTLKPEEGIYPSISLSLLKNELIIKAVSIDSLITATSTYNLNELGFSYLIIENIQSPKLINKPSIGDWWQSMWYIEKAYKAFRYKDWEAFGFNLNLAYEVERTYLELNKKCDIAYAAARSAGATGGYPNEGKLFLICSAEKVLNIKNTLDEICNSEF